MSIKKPKRIVDRKLLDEYRKKNCAVYNCTALEVCAHHIKSKGSGGHDIDENLLPLCFKHHEMIHRSTNKFLEKFPEVKAIIEDKGWSFDGRRWVYPNLF